MTQHPITHLLFLRFVDDFVIGLDDVLGRLLRGARLSAWRGAARAVAARRPCARRRRLVLRIERLTRLGEDSRKLFVCRGWSVRWR